MDNPRRKAAHPQNKFEMQSKPHLRRFTAPYVAVWYGVVALLLAFVLLLSLTAGAPTVAFTTLPAPSSTSSQTPTSLISETAALNTPAPVPLRASPSRLMLVLGALLCIVAPAMLLLGGLIFLAGLGMFDRSRRPPAPPQRPTMQKPTISASSTLLEERPPVPSQPAAKPSTPTKPSSLPASDKALNLGVAAVCPYCGHANRSQARYCAACGKSLQAVPLAEERPSFCWNCGYRLRPTSRYCPRCGDKI